MADKQALIDKMRADWRVVADDRKARGTWSAEDEKEIGDLVKAAVQGQDESLLTCWARWLADLSAATLLLATVARGIDGHIRAAQAEAKAKALAK